MVYKICRNLLNQRKLTQEKLDVFYAMERLSAAEYTELTELLAAQNAEG